MVKMKNNGRSSLLSSHRAAMMIAQASGHRALLYLESRIAVDYCNIRYEVNLESDYSLNGTKENDFEK
jgi:hypothetical protein